MMELKQTLDLSKDMEYLTYFEAKKQFYSETRNKQFTGDSIPGADFLAISTMSVTDSVFLSYLNKKLNSTDPLISTLEKCTTLIGANKLKDLQQSALNKRNQSLENYLTSKLNLPSNRFMVSTNADATLVPEDKIPRYLISYSVPE
jgi:hypothetical protein